MITFTLDGRSVQAEEGEYLIRTARREGVEIPTLCHHPALEPAGMCRLCTVEMFDGRRSRFVTACNYPVWEGMEIRTDTPTVIEGRKLIVELLLARCGDDSTLRALAGKYGISEPRFPKTADDCILCGLCVRVCERMGTSAIELTGRGVELKVGTPFEIQTEACIACGACASVCPTGCITIDGIRERITRKRVEIIPSEHEQGLKGRKPIYVPYAQAIPNAPAIDRSTCVHYKTGGCKICAEICPVKAIDHTTADETIELEVGAVVMTSGFVPFDPATYDIYGYKRYPNVMTSLEFERMLSASGPSGGHVVRPSDHRPPGKIAWLQCVGSRDTHPGASGYCSSVCCTYAVKEAVLAKDHVKGVDAAIFYIDMRTHGKDFETYYTQARDRAGVRFIKSRIAAVNPAEGDRLAVSFTDPDGRRHEEAFDILVLSVGMCLSKDARELAGRLAVDIDSNGFPVTGSFSPVSASRPGIFVCGTAQSPQDIPSSVINAGAAAGAVGALLSEARWSETRVGEVRSERNVNGLAPRIGVFVCHCGTNIAGTVDVHAVAEYARSLPFVAYAATNLFSCSQDTQQAMAGLIEEHSLNRIVVAACTPRTHEAIFQETLRSAGVNKYLFEMANIRNHCSWVHGGDPAAATRKSKDLVRMAVEKAMLIKPLVQHQMEVDQKALVIGGGIAGLTAAKTLAGQGFFTYLVERSDRLGGQANAVIETWKGEDIAEKRDTLIRAVRSSPNIEVHLNTELKEVEGSLGSFKTRLVSGGNTFEVSHGAAVIATGALELKPSDHLYGRHAGVMTLLELDAKLKTGDDPAGSVVFLQCVGSRIPERPYCSKVCCTHAVKSALRLKERNPETAVHILYRDMRTYGLRETLYREAREKGIHFLRFDPEKGLEVAEEAGAIRIVFHDPVLNRKLLLNPDRLVLSTAMVPPDGTPLARMFKVPLKADGFFIEAHVKLRPVDFATDGVFVCGLAHGPKPIDETTAQAQAAAARAAIVLGKPKMWVGGIVSRIDKSLCSRCCVCEAICPYRAITTDQKTHAEVNPALCKGCGLCSASCRSGAATLDGFTDAEILTQICAVQA